MGLLSLSYGQLCLYPKAKVVGNLLLYCRTATASINLPGFRGFQIRLISGVQELRDNEA